MNKQINKHTQMKIGVYFCIYKTEDRTLLEPSHRERYFLNYILHKFHVIYITYIV